MRTVVLPEGVPDVSACVLSLCLGAMKRRADAVGPATRQSARHQKMQATAGAAVREPAPQEDPEQLLRARRAARDAIAARLLLERRHPRGSRSKPLSAGPTVRCGRSWQR